MDNTADIASLRRLITKLRELAAQGTHGAWSEADGALAWLNLRRATEAMLRALETPTHGGTAEQRALATLRQLAAEGLVSTALVERFVSWVAARGEGFPALLTPREAIAGILIPRTDDLEALAEMLAARSHAAPPTSAANRAKAFVLGDRRIELESLADDEWRVVLEGVPIPMTFRETESTRTNSAYYDKELRPARAVTAIDFGPCVRQGEPFEVERTKDGWRAVCRWKASATAMYNTVIYDLEFHRPPLSARLLFGGGRVGPSHGLVQLKVGARRGETMRKPNAPPSRTTVAALAALVVLLGACHRGTEEVDGDAPVTVCTAPYQRCGASGAGYCIRRALCPDAGSCLFCDIKH